MFDDQNNTQNTHHEDAQVNISDIQRSQEEEVLNEEQKHHNGKVKRSMAVFAIFVLLGGFSIGSGIQISRYYLDRKFQNYNVYNTQGGIEYEQGIKTQIADNPIVRVVKEVGESVVAIRSQATARDFFLNEYTQEGLGSGVIFNINDQNVLILTNNHVVEGARNLTVTLDKDKDFEADVVGVDPESDLAVVKIDKKQIPEDVASRIKPVVFGDSDQLQIGEIAVAIGNPLGYSNTVTHGVISGLDREIRLPDKRLKVIQTDAAINPGNSGGALTNLKGQLVGINTVKIADTKVEGIGFAIPINYAKPIINDLVKQGYVSRPYIGIAGREVDESLSKLYDLPIGVIVADVVDGGSAKRAGIKKGDVIIALGDKKIISMEDLTSGLKDYKVGDTVNITIVRNGKDRIEKKVILQDKNSIRR